MKYLIGFLVVFWVPIYLTLDNIQNPPVNPNYIFTVDTSRPG